MFRSSNFQAAFLLGKLKRFKDFHMISRVNYR